MATSSCPWPPVPGHLSLATSVQAAAEVGQTFDIFLADLGFQTGTAYGDVQPTDKRTPGGLASVLGMDSLHKARNSVSFWMSDTFIPTVGGVVAFIGAVSLLIYVRRNTYKESRR